MYCCRLLGANQLAEFLGDNMRKLLILLAATFLSLAANAAPVQTVDSVGDSFTIYFNGIVGNSNPTVMPGLTASAQFTVTSWATVSGQTTVKFDILVTNTSDASIWQSAVVTAVGFDTDPNATSGSVTGVFGRFVMGGRLPTGSGFNVEYCTSNNGGSNNHPVCGGPGNTPLNVGQSGIASVTMTFAGNISDLDFSNFGIRWQNLGSRQLGLRGASGIGIGTATPPIPEPAAMAVFGLGALLVGATFRRRAA
jgi:hypothetical protein